MEGREKNDRGCCCCRPIHRPPTASGGLRPLSVASSVVLAHLTRAVQQGRERVLEEEEEPPSCLRAFVGGGGVASRKSTSSAEAGEVDT